MTKIFRPLSELVSSSEGSIDVIIQQWIDGKLPLYVYFDGRHPVCTFRRCISIDEHKCAMLDITYGRDLYQHSDSPEYEQRLFVPESPLDSHLKIKPDYSHGGMVYEYKYRGRAYGYWLAKPTKTAKFRRKDFLLADYSLIEFKPETIGDVTIHSDKDRDFLSFHEELYIEKSELYIRIDELTQLNNQHMGWDGLSDSSHHKEEICSKSESNSNILVAFYLVIHDWSIGEREGAKIVVNTLVDFFNEICEINISTGTIKNCAEKPVLNSQKFKSRRETEGVRRAFYHLLLNYCEVKELRNVSDLVDKLNELAHKHGYGQEITFGTIEVAVWKNKPTPSKKHRKRN